MEQQRQGEILLEAVEKVEGEIIGEKSEFVLAEGKSTTNRHVLKGKKMKIYRSGDVLFLSLSAKTKLVHPEHADLALKKGNYKVIRQREYDIREGIREVSD
jgi:hypothetical protein